MTSPEQRLADLGLALPPAHPVVANYAPCVASGALLFVAGHGPFVGGRPAHLGTVGVDVSVEEAREAARVVILNMLGTLKAELGELSRITRWVRAFVMVNAAPTFHEHYLVADGATDLLVAVFGEAGRPARSTVGMSLPFDMSVEIEAVVEHAP